MTNDQIIERIMDLLMGLPLGDAVGILELVKHTMIMEGMEFVEQERVIQ